MLHFALPFSRMCRDPTHPGIPNIGSLKTFMQNKYDVSGSPVDPQRSQISYTWLFFYSWNVNPYRKIRVRPSSGSPEEPNKLYIIVFWSWSGLLGGNWRQALGADLRLVLHLSNPASGARAP